MNCSSIHQLPAVRLASGVEPQQKWTHNNNDTNKVDLNRERLRLIDMTPTQGIAGVVITVVVQALPNQIPVKLAFNNLMVDTQQMQVQNMTTLVAAVPPFQQTHSSNSAVPISVCFLDKDVVTKTDFVAQFHYCSTEEVDKHKEDTFNGTTAMVTQAPLIDNFGPKNNEFLNTSNANFYSSLGDPYGAFGSQVPSYQPYYQELPQDQKAIFKDNHYFDNLLTDNIPREHGFKLKSSLHMPPNTTSVANYQPYPGLISRTNLDLQGDLNRMMQDWSPEEWNSGRRLVQFFKQEDKSSNKIKCEFQSLIPGNIPKKNNSDTIIVSCIHWAERNDFFITSVDCIYLLESLMGIRFSVEEKNRIRRNLEGFRPLTVSKCKPESANFFKLIMGFPNPKPRNIEKDVKVFSWKALPYALKKIVTKYTASAFNKSSAMIKPVTHSE